VIFINGSSAARSGRVGKNDGIIEGADVIRIERKLAIIKAKTLKKIAGKNNVKDCEGFYEI